MSEGALFVERRSYRRRRLRDAGRLLPVVGALLMALPVLWPTGGAGTLTSGAGVYLFAVWGVLIVCAAALSRVLARREVQQGEPGASGPG